MLSKGKNKADWWSHDSMELWLELWPSLVDEIWNWNYEIGLWD